MTGLLQMVLDAHGGLDRWHDIGTLAVHARIPVQRLREMIYAYPTFHRAVSDALSQLDAC